MSEELAAQLAAKLRDAHRRVRSLQLPEDEKATLARRLLALTDISKRDLERASQRLDRFLADLDAGCAPGPDSPEGAG